MSSGFPPSSQRAPADPRLAAARGLVRESIGALKNLQQLLESIRVGPRALASVIPDALASCAPLRGAFRELYEALAARLPDTQATSALEQFVTPRLDALEHALAEAGGRALNARTRLGLERVVGQSARDLEAARALVDLLDDAVSRPALTVDIVELLRQSARGADAAGGTVTAVLSGSRPSCELPLEPRVTTALVGIGVELVARHTGKTPCIEIDVSPDGVCSLTVAAGPCQGEEIVLPARTLATPTLACAEAAAMATGAHLTRSDDGSRFQLVWPRRTG